MTRQERIWRCIKDNGPISVADMAAMLDLPARNLSHSLYDMRKRCRLESVGGGCGRRWIVPKGERFKPGGKGSNPNSRKNLVRWSWQKGMAAMRQKRGLPPKTDMTLLDQCWRGVVAMKTGHCDDI